MLSFFLSFTEKLPMNPLNIPKKQLKEWILHCYLIISSKVLLTFPLLIKNKDEKLFELDKFK